MSVEEILKAPFPAFGGKSRVADEVWARFGGAEDPVRNYVEPFAFSAAVLLRRPGGAQGIETINDRNAYVANFWRAVHAAPELVAQWADSPVNEVDLHARHRWLVGSDEAVNQLNLVREDAFAFDAKIAGWWCWGACCWIGSGWCDETNDGDGNGVNRLVPMRTNMPHFDRGSRGVISQKIPELASGRGVASNQGVGTGVHAQSPAERQPALGQPALGQPGWGVTANGKRPRLGAFDQPGLGVCGELGGDGDAACAARRAWITDWMLRLKNRLRSVRVCCGHWSRVCDSPSTMMTRLGLTGVFLDPPYRHKLGDGSVNRSKHIYANDRHQDVDALCDEVQEYAVRWGDDKMARIALCGLAGEYPEIDKRVGPGGWQCFEWKSNGGYGNRSGENENAARERIWFSPACVVPREPEAGLFN